MITSYTVLQEIRLTQNLESYAFPCQPAAGNPTQASLVTFVILVSYFLVWMEWSHSINLAVPHQSAAVQIPFSQNHRELFKAKLILFENGKKMP